MDAVDSVYGFATLTAPPFYPDKKPVDEFTSSDTLPHAWLNPDNLKLFRPQLHRRSVFLGIFCYILVTPAEMVGESIIFD